MVVQVIGKQHIFGTSSKTGKTYDFSKAYCSYMDSHVEGAACREFLLPAGFDSSKILVGQYYNFDFDFSGRLTSISPAKV